MHRQIAGKLTGRVTKWVVLAFWIIIVMAAGSVASKLTDVQDNQASSWLPASAESTKALDKLAPFQNQNGRTECSRGGSRNSSAVLSNLPPIGSRAAQSTQPMANHADANDLPTNDD